MKRKLLIPIILTQALFAYAQPVTTTAETSTVGRIKAKYDEWNNKLMALCPDDKPVDIENVQASSNKIWKEIVNQLNTARISTTTDQKINLSDRSSFNFGKTSGSETSIGGKFSGIDKWKIDFNALLFEQSFIDFGISGNREITFIQQFPSRCKSLIRTAYDPITKLPLSAEHVLNELKPGDFVAYSSPLTLGLGKSLDRFVKSSDSMKTLGNVSFYASGEFNIHVYRMEDNHVRVRFFAAKSKGMELSPGFKLMVLDGLLGLRLFELNAGFSNSDIFSADYVFNLNKLESRIMYDKLMGKKLSLKKLNIEGVNNPFEKDNTVKNHLYADLGEIQNAALQDISLPLNDRRVIRLSQADTNTKANRFGLGMNLKVARASVRTTYSNSNVSSISVDNENRNYIVKAITRERQFGAFSIWGQHDSHNTALVVETDANYSPRVSAGLQTIRVKEEISFSKNEIKSLAEKLKNTLPEKISKLLDFSFVSNLSETIANARIEQSIYLDSQKLENAKSITYQKVAAELKKLIRNSGSISSIPMNVDMRVSSSEMDQRGKDKIAAESKLLEHKDIEAGKLYESAFSYEIGYIPTYLVTLFGEGAIADKLKAYDSLQEITLFNELGSSLVLNLIAAEDEAGTLKLEDVMTYRLAITGRGIEPKITEFPVDRTGIDSQSLKNSEIFQRILNDNNFLTDRSFNLRYYMNEKGDSLTLQQVVERAKER